MHDEQRVINNLQISKISYKHVNSDPKARAALICAKRMREEPFYSQSFTLLGL
jgi:hypothetical protein